MNKYLCLCKEILHKVENVKSFFFFSVSKFIRIGIADKNDNPPYFDKGLYEAEVCNPTYLYKGLYAVEVRNLPYRAGVRNPFYFD